mgnify:CR=1 FL=1|jgi:hypothetical protein
MMEFLKDVKKIQVAQTLEVEGRTIHAIVEVYTVDGSNYFTQQVHPICLAVEDTEDYIIPLKPVKSEAVEEDSDSGEILDLGMDPDEIWKMVKENQRKRSGN